MFHDCFRLMIMLIYLLPENVDYKGNNHKFRDITKHRHTFEEISTKLAVLVHLLTDQIQFTATTSEAIFSHRQGTVRH